jgi:hypothetical protein
VPDLSPADRLLDELDALRTQPAAVTPLLRALAPIADAGLSYLRLGVAGVYTTLPTRPGSAVSSRTFEAVEELATALTR